VLINREGERGGEGPVKCDGRSPGVNDTVSVGSWTVVGGAPRGSLISGEDCGGMALLDDDVCVRVSKDPGEEGTISLDDDVCAGVS
jgi:hypothetical protein